MKNREKDIFGGVNWQIIKEKKNNNGITLIALVITIIVLLILSGVTIAVLTGQNGILRNASSANMHNVYYGAEEQVKLAYMAVQTEITIRVAENSNYNATTEENTNKIGKIVDKELNKSEWNVNYDKGGIINITYTNPIITKDAISNGKPFYNGLVKYDIILEMQSAKLVTDISEIDYGEETASTISQGDTIKIANEQFMILSNSNNKIVAIPYTNITWSTFSESKYWTSNYANIEPMENSNIQKYISAYNNKLQSIVGGIVTAKVPRMYGNGLDNISSYKDLENSEGIKLLNPTGGPYWFGSSYKNDTVYLVWGNGGFNYRGITSKEGVRAVIIIDNS